MKYGAPEGFFKTCIFSGQMKHVAPEKKCFPFFPGQMKHRAPEKIGENFKKPEFRQ